MVAFEGRQMCAWEQVKMKAEGWRLKENLSSFILHPPS
jgi:hypothetical protein